MVTHPREIRSFITNLGHRPRPGQPAAGDAGQFGRGHGIVDHAADRGPRRAAVRAGPATGRSAVTGQTDLGYLDPHAGGRALRPAPGLGHAGQTARLDAARLISPITYCCDNTAPKVDHFVSIAIRGMG